MGSRETLIPLIPKISAMEPRVCSDFHASISVLFYFYLFHLGCFCFNVFFCYLFFLRFGWNCTV